MICFLGFPFLFFMSLKYFYYFSCLIVFDSFFFFMSSISFFIVCLVFFFNFSLVYYLESYLYFFLAFVMVVFMNFSFMSVNFFSFLFFFELSVFPMFYFLICFSKDYDKVSSMFFMMMINSFGSVPLMFFISYFFWCGGSSSSFILFFNYLHYFFCFDSFYFLILMSFMFLSKLPVYFLHFWLPKAHVSASASCSMLLASLMLKLGTFGLLKFSYFFSYIIQFSCLVFSVLSSFTSLFLTFMMLRYFDQKYLVAVSSVLHMSTMPVFFFSLNSVGLVSCVFMASSHGLISFFLFFIVSLIYEQTHNRSLDFNKSLESFSKYICGFVFIYFFLSMGVPPFINFFSEFCSLLFFINYSLICLIIILFFMLIVNVFTMYFCVKSFIGKKVLIVFNDLNLSFFFFSVFNLILLLYLPLFL